MMVQQDYFDQEVSTTMRTRERRRQLAGNMKTPKRHKTLFGTPSEAHKKLDPFRDATRTEA